MLKKEKERDAAFAKEVLCDCQYATISMVNADGTPYCIPVHIVLKDDSVYFHCATEGQKLENIKRNGTVCVSAVRRTRVIPEKFTADFESAVMTGKCEIVTDEKDKIGAMRAICEKYAASNMSNFAVAATPDKLLALCICKISIEQITGKSSGGN